MSTENTTPEKYRPDPPEYWEKKEWLYEQYWGELLSTREIAEKAGVDQYRIRELLVEHGIVRRPAGYAQSVHTSPIMGFYHRDESVPANHTAGDAKDEWEERTSGDTLVWEKAYEIENHSPGNSTRTTVSDT